MLKSTVKLTRNQNGENVTYLVPLLDAVLSFSGDTATIIWDNINFHLDLSNEAVRESWDILVENKNELHSQHMKAYDIENYIKEMVTKNLDAVQEKFNIELAQIVTKNTNQLIETQTSIDTRVESVRAEYSATISGMNDVLSDMTEAISSIGGAFTDISKEVKNISGVTRNIASLKKDLNEVTDTLKSLMQE